MITHPPLSILIISQGVHSPLHPLITYFQRIPNLSLCIAPELPQEISHFQVIVTSDLENFGDPPERLRQYVLAGGGWIGLVNAMDGPLPENLWGSTDPCGARLLS